jgi:hypothetical protein
MLQLLWLALTPQYNLGPTLSQQATKNTAILQNTTENNMHQLTKKGYRPVTHSSKLIDWISSEQYDIEYSPFYRILL